MDHSVTVDTIREAVTEKFKNIPETEFSRAMEKLSQKTYFHILNENKKQNIVG